MEYKWYLVPGLPDVAVLDRVLVGPRLHSREEARHAMSTVATELAGLKAGGYDDGYDGIVKCRKELAMWLAGLALIDAPPGPAAVARDKFAKLGRWCLDYAKAEFTGRGHSAWIGADSIMDQAVDLDLGAMIAYDPKLHCEDRVVEDDQRFYFFGEGTPAYDDPKWREVCNA